MIKVSIKVEVDHAQVGDATIELSSTTDSGNPRFIGARTYEEIAAITEHMIPMIEARYGKKPKPNQPWKPEEI